MTPSRLLPPALLAAAALAAGAAAAAGQAQAPPPATAPTPTTPTAPAAPASFTFAGRGFGHGIGMSQYGARGRALAGWSAHRILAAYFTGVKFGKAPNRTVRVLLATGLQEARFWSPRRWRLLGRRPGGRNVTHLRTGVTYMLQARADGTLAVKRGRTVVAVVAGPVRFQSRARGGWVAWGRTQPESARRYRGGIRALPSGGGRFDLVNVVDMEDYLRGVVPREMPSSWGDDAPAALSAQAIAARSYVLSTMAPTSTYDVFDDERSQVYGGVDAEDPRSNRAVRQTRGTVLTYDGAVITAYFFSTSGGRTEDVQNVFAGSSARPYLKSVPDPFDKISPFHVWPDPPTFSARRLGDLLGLGAPVTSVDVVRRGISPRVVQVKVTTTTGRTATFSGWTMRGKLGLRDTWFSVRPNAAGTAGR
ncbi:MAG: SpoIID/LytB domain-containing protein [Thermoleophilia bacterium]